MKLNETNARFAVVRTAFHGGGTISFHNSLKEAMKIKKANTQDDCECGCCTIVPVTEEAKKELSKIGYYSNWLYEELPFYEANGEHYSAICR